jgi:hypothetical protein
MNKTFIGLFFIGILFFNSYGTASGGSGGVVIEGEWIFNGVNGASVTLDFKTSTEVQVTLFQSGKFSMATYKYEVAGNKITFYIPKKTTSTIKFNTSDEFQIFKFMGGKGNPVFEKVGSLPTVSGIPEIKIDYSKIGPEDSVILAYVDPKLVTTVKNVFEFADFTPYWYELIVGVDDEHYSSSPMSNAVFKRENVMAYEPFQTSCQMQIPNGTHTVRVFSQKLTDILPFEAAFDNVAVTYRIRFATTEEKRAAGIGVGNIVFTMEEVAQVKLR